MTLWRTKDKPPVELVVANLNKRKKRKNMLSFGDFERRMLSYFQRGTEILHNGKRMIVEEAGKPPCSYGEPKTDVYVAARSNYGIEEIKISYKKENANFLENKMNSERAEQLFGPDWRKIIEDSTSGIRSQFEQRMRVYKEKFRKIEKGAITLGWKFELLNKPGGELSGEMCLSRQQLYDVYAGTNLSPDKRNAYVNGRLIRNSGIAEYILVSDTARSAQDVIDRMVPIGDYIERHPKIYFACKALNYRTYYRKYDGNRPLAVQVDWNIVNGKLSSSLIFDAPLEANGDEMASRLLYCLGRLSINTTDDINSNNSDMRNVYH